MSDDRRYESDDLGDYENLDASDTLDGAPGDDPLDQGLIAPQHWPAGARFGTTAEEQEEGESLDQQLDEEEPDIWTDDRRDLGWDENATDEDVSRLQDADGPDPRAGRLVGADDDAHLLGADDLVARDAGIAGGAASAEEAAVHSVDESELPDS